jgi:hypothetical protein
MVFKKKSRWSPPLGASVALKIGKNRLEAKKVTPSEVGGFIFNERKNSRSFSS